MTEQTERYSERLLGLLKNEIEEREKRIYSEKVLKEYQNPKNNGKIDNYNAYGIIKGSCGDTVELYLKIDNNKITNISFITDGCKATVACCSILTDMVKGMEINDAKEISSNDLIFHLSGLPIDHEHCAVLTVGTLRKAIRKYNENAISPK